MRPPILERYASGQWLTPALMTFASFTTLFVSIAALAHILLTANGYIDSHGRAIGTDFSGIWPAGKMVLNGLADRVYDWDAVRKVQQELLGIRTFTPWIYPPVFLLAATALATLPFGLALFSWQLIGIAAAAGVLVSIVPGWKTLLIGAGFPGIIVCVGHGQTGFLTAALLAGGLVLLPRREILAGILFGLLVYKPQFGLLLPFVLAAGGYWRAIVSAALTVALLVAVTVGIWGVSIWQAFFGSLGLARAAILKEGSTGFEKLQSLFAWVRLVGGSTTTAYAVQSVVSLTVFVLCVWLWRNPASFALKAAALLTGALILTPYVFDYDMICLGMAIAFLFSHGLQHGFIRWEKTLLAVAWFAPAVARNVVNVTFVPLGFIVLSAVFALIVVRARGELGQSKAGFAVPA